MKNLVLQSQQENKDRVVVVSGNRTRNRDWFSNKPFRIIPGGVRTNKWLKNNVVLWLHNFNIPVGIAGIKLEGNQLVVDGNINFHRKILPIAAEGIGNAVGEFDTGVIAALWEEGYLNATSVHLSFSPEDEEAIIELDSEVVIPQSEMIEFSIVTVPGDADATRERMLQLGASPQMVQFCFDGKCQGHGVKLIMEDTDMGEQEVVQEVEETPVEEIEEAVEEELTLELEEESTEVELDVDLLINWVLDNPNYISRFAQALGITALQERIDALEQNRGSQQPINLRLIGSRRQEEATIEEEEQVPAKPQRPKSPVLNMVIRK